MLADPADSFESDEEERDVQGGRLALGPFRLSKLGMASVLATFSIGMGPFGRCPGDRNFDAGPWRDINFDPLSWLEPPFCEVKKH